MTKEEKWEILVVMRHDKHIEISRWTEFENDLRERLGTISHRRMIALRNFGVDRLKIALRTGTDRDDKSTVWEETDFDFSYNSSETVMSAAKIIYVHRVNHTTSPFTVLNLGARQTCEQTDLTALLCVYDAVSVYDIAKLQRKAINEHWFAGPPNEALLFIYSVSSNEGD